MPRVGLFTIVSVGDIGAISLDQVGCEVPGCDCGMVAYGLVLHQVDGQGLRVNAPKEAWVALTAVLAKTMASAHPDEYVAALDHVDRAAEHPEQWRTVFHFSTDDDIAADSWVLYTVTDEVHRVRSIATDTVVACCGQVMAAGTIMVVTDDNPVLGTPQVCGACRTT